MDQIYRRTSSSVNKDLNELRDDKVPDGVLCCEPKYNSQYSNDSIDKEQTQPAMRYITLDWFINSLQILPAGTINIKRNSLLVSKKVLQGCENIWHHLTGISKLNMIWRHPTGIQQEFHRCHKIFENFWRYLTGISSISQEFQEEFHRGHKK